MSLRLKRNDLCRSEKVGTVALQSRFMFLDDFLTVLLSNPIKDSRVC